MLRGCPRFLGWRLELEVYCVEAAIFTDYAFDRQYTTYQKRPHEIAQDVAKDYGFTPCVFERNEVLEPSSNDQKTPTTKTFSQDKPSIPFLADDVARFAIQAGTKSQGDYQCAVEESKSVGHVLHFHPILPTAIVRHYKYARAKDGVIISWAPNFAPNAMILGAALTHLEGHNPITKKVDKTDLNNATMLHGPGAAASQGPGRPISRAPPLWCFTSRAAMQPRPVPA